MGSNKLKAAAGFLGLVLIVEIALAIWLPLRKEEVLVPEPAGRQVCDFLYFAKLFEALFLLTKFWCSSLTVFTRVFLTKRQWRQTLRSAQVSGENFCLGFWFKLFQTYFFLVKSTCLRTLFDRSLKKSNFKQSTKKRRLVLQKPHKKQLGGNAVDATIGVALCSGVQNMHSCGIGGGSFMLVHNKGKRKFINCRETAPKSASRNFCLQLL